MTGFVSLEVIFVIAGVASPHDHDPPDDLAEASPTTLSSLYPFLSNNLADEICVRAYETLILHGLGFSVSEGCPRAQPPSPCCCLMMDAYLNIRQKQRHIEEPCMES
jgi:hypothetical protein